MKGFRVFLSMIILVESFLCGASVLFPSVLIGQPALYAEDDWKKEFENICSRTEDAMILTKDELRTLIERCDRLKPLVEQLGETERKVYLKRLRMCRDLYVYVLESKEKK
ncbi:MAG: hypothetical protein ABR903_05755 [Thermodesulfovibrionales bacterium]